MRDVMTARSLRARICLRLPMGPLAEPVVTRVACSFRLRLFLQTGVQSEADMHDPDAGFSWQAPHGQGCAQRIFFLSEMADEANLKDWFLLVVKPGLDRAPPTDK